jgi:hypothetical protein
MQTDIDYLLSNVSQTVYPPTNGTAIFVEDVGMDQLIQFLIVITISVMVIAIYTIKNGRKEP